MSNTIFSHVKLTNNLVYKRSGEAKKPRQELVTYKAVLKVDMPKPRAPDLSNAPRYTTRTGPALPDQQRRTKEATRSFLNFPAGIIRL